jgi:hypothetical protein
MNALLLLLAAALGAAPARAVDPLDGPCINEVGLLCSGLSRPATLRCLREQEDSATADCRHALDALSEREGGAPQPSSPAAAEAELSPARDARIVGVFGSVFMRLAGRPFDEFVAVSSGTPLADGDEIRAGTDGTADISFEGKTLVSISSKTELSVTSLQRAGTELNVLIGSISAKVQKLAEGEAFRVRTPAVVAAVRGTELIVTQDSVDGPGRVGVVDEGRVEVESGGQLVILGPRQETSAIGGRPPVTPRPLATLRVRADAFAALRTRADDAERHWRRLSRRLLREARASAAALPTVPVSEVPGLSHPPPAPSKPARPAPPRGKPSPPRKDPPPAGAPDRR